MHWPCLWVCTWYVYSMYACVQTSMHACNMRAVVSARVAKNPGTSRHRARLTPTTSLDPRSRRHFQPEERSWDGIVGVHLNSWQVEFHTLCRVAMQSYDIICNHGA